MPLVTIVLIKELIFPSTKDCLLLSSLRSLCLWRGAPAPCRATIGGGLKGTQLLGHLWAEGRLGHPDHLLWPSSCLGAPPGVPHVFETQGSDQNLFSSPPFPFFPLPPSCFPASFLVCSSLFVGWHITRCSCQFFFLLHSPDS